MILGSDGTSVVFQVIVSFAHDDKIMIANRDSLRKLLSRLSLEEHYHDIRSSAQGTSYDALLTLSAKDLVERCGLDADAATALRRAATQKTGAWAKFKRRNSRFVAAEEEVEVANDDGIASYATSSSTAAAAVVSATVDKAGGRRRQSMIGRLLGRKGEWVGLSNHHRC